MKSKTKEKIQEMLDDGSFLSFFMEIKNEYLLRGFALGVVFTLTLFIIFWIMFGG